LTASIESTKRIAGLSNDIPTVDNLRNFFLKATTEMFSFFEQSQEARLLINPNKKPAFGNCIDQYVSSFNGG
jgi:hypothetical protein